ncbi:MAG: hypothetical protein EAZ97_13505 [Bacteroidetes bacterium]|nr:MAG: hypothetical protein EAZ97_13505 [Bacteroidota bacterium]
MNYKIFIFAFLFFAACKEKEMTSETNLQMIFDHRVGNQGFFLQKRYQNDLKEEYLIEDFRYYISNITLKGANSVFQEKESYHLIMPASDKSTVSIDLGKIPEGNYQTLEISIGVDKTHNTSIYKIGDLDPSSSMAWDWTKGYKFLLLEGKHFAKNDQGDALVYHVGEDVNYAVLSFPINLLVVNGKNTKINMVTDLNKLFSQISFSQINTAMFGENARKIAINYSKDMISVKSVE